MTPEVMVPWGLTLATIVFGIFKFAAERRQANRQPFLQKQLELCFQAAEAAGGLASETDPARWETYRLTFWRLYWGPLSIVEDRAVEEAMVKLGKLVPTKDLPAPTLPMSDLEDPSYELAHACR